MFFALGMFAQLQSPPIRSTLLTLLIGLPFPKHKQSISQAIRNIYFLCLLYIQERELLHTKGIRIHRCIMYSSIGIYVCSSYLVLKIYEIQQLNQL